jgi:vitamin B12 transporter
VVGALEGKQEHSDNSGTPASSRISRSERLGWLGKYDNAGQPIEAQASLRNDVSSTYGGARTGLLALAWSPLPAWKLSTQWATAFSAPAFSDQQFALPGVTLRPERSRNVELAAQFQQERNSARLAWFKQRQHDRIGSDANFNSINIANAANSGFELLGQAALGSTQIGGEAIWQNPRDLDANKLLARRSRQTTVLTIQQPLGTADVGAAIRRNGQRADVVFNPDFSQSDVTVPGRTTLALSAGYKISPAWRLAAKLDNATNNRSPEVLGYNPAPRSLGVSLSGKL